jgi:hypothetical protein
MNIYIIAESSEIQQEVKEYVVRRGLTGNIIPINSLNQATIKMLGFQKEDIIVGYDFASFTPTSSFTNIINSFKELYKIIDDIYIVKYDIHINKNSTYNFNELLDIASSINSDVFSKRARITKDTKAGRPKGSLSSQFDVLLPKIAYLYFLNKAKVIDIARMNNLSYKALMAWMKARGLVEERKMLKKGQITYESVLRKYGVSEDIINTVTEKRG